MLSGVVGGVICSEGGGREVQSGSAGATEEVGVNVRRSSGGPGHKGVLQGEEEEKMRSDAGGENRSEDKKNRKMEERREEKEEGRRRGER